MARLLTYRSLASIAALVLMLGTALPLAAGVCAATGHARKAACPHHQTEHAPAQAGCGHSHAPVTPSQNTLDAADTAVCACKPADGPGAEVQVLPRAAERIVPLLATDGSVQAPPALPGQTFLPWPPPEDPPPSKPARLLFSVFLI